MTITTRIVVDNYHLTRDCVIVEITDLYLQKAKWKNSANMVNKMWLNAKYIEKYVEFSNVVRQSMNVIYVNYIPNQVEQLQLQ